MEFVLSDDLDFKYATKGSAGIDIMAAEDALVYHNKVVKINTGLRVSIPEGYEGQLRLRSSLASRGLALANGVGTIDSDYRGELGVLLTTWIETGFTIHKGDRIAQLVITPVVRAELKRVKSLDNTLRSEGGFGSTGV